MAWYADKTIIPAAIGGGDFTNLAAFEAFYDGLDISGTDGVRARHRGLSDDSSEIYFSDWQSGQSSSCKIVITAETNYGIQDRSGWTGADGSGDDARLVYPIQVSEATNAIYMDTNNIEMAQEIKWLCAAGGELRVWNCLIRDSTNFGIRVASCGTSTIYLANLLIRDCGNASYEYGIWINDADATVYIWNVTIDQAGGPVTFGYGLVKSAGTDETRNVVAINASKFDFNGLGDEDYSATSDNTSSGANSIDSITLADNFTDHANEDYTVKDTTANCDIYHAGADQPSWFDTLTGGNDIVGNPYHATTPSIGCFEYAVGGGPTPTSGTSNGLSTVEGAIKALASVTGASSGLSTDQAIIKALLKAIGSSGGIATVEGTLQEAAQSLEIYGNAQGVATVQAIIKALASVDGTSSGVALVEGVAKAILKAVGSATGAAILQGTLQGFSDSTISGTSQGLAIVQAIIKALLSAQGTSEGLATAEATWKALAKISGESFGVATGSGTLAAYSAGAMSASTTGVATVDGLLKALASIEGTSTGIATVVATPRPDSAWVGAGVANWVTVLPNSRSLGVQYESKRHIIRVGGR